MSQKKEAKGKNDVTIARLKRAMAEKDAQIAALQEELSKYKDDDKVRTSLQVRDKLYMMRLLHEHDIAFQLPSMGA